ncbi:hypothetical protein [Aquabacterium sp. NJ1]|uniref:hypothetical protein n=1 Tax=Aquabacterium sp. NJ1 TaxID=1538295 RepID=UPI0013778740|nr:hypothetical protein [Aquabacterium sp. NJ1]
MKPIDWRLAADTASELPDVSPDTAIGCASGSITTDALTKMANMHAMASLARRQDITVRGQESLQGNQLETTQEERSVALLPRKTAKYSDLIKTGSRRTACVLITNYPDHE